MASACTSTSTDPYLYVPTGPGTSTGAGYLQDLALGSRSPASSRPSTSSSYASSVAYPASATSSNSYSSLQPSPVASHPSPTSPAFARMRPLPTPPATPSSSRAALPPRPLPKPPLQRAQSHQVIRPISLLAPPPGRRVPAGIVTPSPEAQIPPPLQSAPPERPSIRLNISDMRSTAPLSAQNFTSPLSPIAFNLPGPRRVRKRREEELARRMKALGFVEAPSPTAERPKSASGVTSESMPGPSSYSRTPAKEPSPTFTESDDERDVVLLVENDSDVDEHPIQPPPRSTSRDVMLSLFPDDSPGAEGTVSFLDAPGYGERNPWKDGDPDQQRYGGRTSPHVDVRVDVEVEVVTKEAVARTKRRFTRKWVRERKGKRWTERDFGEILCQLRKLR